MEFEIIDNYKSEILRKNFIEKFIDTSTDYFQKYIASPSKYEKGEFYDGYLWDCLKNTCVCSPKDAFEYVCSKENVLAMWDLFSNKRVSDNSIFSQDYPKKTIIKINGTFLAKQIMEEWETDYSEAAKGLWLPQDIYVFDNSMSWCVIFTHETTGETNERWCIINV